MPKQKNIADEGEVIDVPVEKLQKPLTVSHAQAKKLVKRAMTEKQSENVKKMVESNRQKWELIKASKEEALKKEVSDQVEKTQLAKENKTVQEVVVLPKRIYKKRKVLSQQESESESYLTDSSEEEEEPPKKSKKINRQVAKNIEAIKQIDNVINQSSGNKYLAMLKF